VQGIVKTFDSNRGIGIIHGKNGGNYPVILADVITPQPLKTGQLVRFSLRFVNDHAFATNVDVSAYRSLIR
jgi:cold shock CspA family protein